MLYFTYVLRTPTKAIIMNVGNCEISNLTIANGKINHSNFGFNRFKIFELRGSKAEGLHHCQYATAMACKL